MINYRERILSLTILIVSMTVCGFISLTLGKDLCWDIANYHYYNPYAFLHHRWTSDVWPVSYLHVNLNPSADLLSYFLINSFTPKNAVFLSGALHGVNCWLLFQIARYLLPNYDYPIAHNIVALMTVFLGMFGPIGLPGIGIFQNDHTVCTFVLIFVLLQLKGIANYSSKWTIAAGLFLGIGAGLKLTACSFVVGAGLAFVCLPISWRNKIKIMFFWSISVALGMILSSGYWMMLMWQQHHNPLFPFFNTIFHSSDFPDISFLYDFITPLGFWKKLFYPFYYSFYGTLGEGEFRDFRFLLVYILFLVAGIQWAWKKIRYQDRSHLNLINWWFFSFFIVSYVVNQIYFVSLRYVVALEMLAPLMIYLLIIEIFKNKIHEIILFAIVFFLLVLTMTPVKTFVRITYYKGSYFNVKLPNFIQEHSEGMVLLAYAPYAFGPEPRPQAYLIPFFPPKWRFVGVPIFDGKFYPEMNVAEKIKYVVNTYSGKIYLLTSDFAMPELYKTAKEFGLSPDGPCEDILSDRQKVSSIHVYICPVVKKPKFGM